MTGATLVLALAATMQGGGAPSVQPQRTDARARDTWFGADKLKHFFVAAFTQTVAYSALQAARVGHEEALAGAWGFTAAISVAKEIRDRRTTGVFSVRDLVWDAAGAGAATVLLTRARRTEPSDDPAPTSTVSPAARRAAVFRASER